MKSANMTATGLGVFLAMTVCTLGASAHLRGGETEVLAEVDKLFDPEGGIDDVFGVTIALDGDRFAARGGFADEGIAIYERDSDGRWTFVAQIFEPPGNSETTFPSTLALEGDRLLIGASTSTFTGKAYVYERDASGEWLEAAQFEAEVGNEEGRFGNRLSLDGDRVAVGADGLFDFNDLSSAYVFDRAPDGSWVQSQVLQSSDLQLDDQFGAEIELDGDRIVVSATDAPPVGDGDGKAYVFELGPSGLWEEVAILRPSDGIVDDNFGSALGLLGDRIAVGADLHDGQGLSQGAVYIFERTPQGDWSEVQKIRAPDGGINHNFGNQLVLEADRLTVSAPGDTENGNFSGSIYVYEIDSNGLWTFTQKLLSLDGGSQEYLGTSLAAENGLALAGGNPTQLGGGSDPAYISVFETVTVSPALSLEGACPGPVEIVFSGATPRSQFNLYGATAEGSTTLATGPCAGTALALEDAFPLRQFDTDFDGEVFVTPNVPEAKCGTRLQFVDLTTCLVSPVGTVPFAVP